MAGPNLPVNIDSTYVDDAADASVKTHQQHHDVIHTVLNLLDAVTGSPQIIFINNQTGTSYTVALSDAGKVVETTNASAVTITVPPNSSVAFPIGSVIEFCQVNTGQITLTPGSGVTLSTPSTRTTRARYSTIGIRKRATDEWIVSGDLT